MDGMDYLPPVCTVQSQERLSTVISASWMCSSWDGCRLNYEPVMLEEVPGLYTMATEQLMSLFSGERSARVDGSGIFLSTATKGMELTEGPVSSRDHI